jgi:hypothetical protein
MNNNGNKTVLTAGNPVVIPGGNNNNQPGAKSRIHIKKQLGNGVEINVFGDDPDSTFALIISTINLCEGDSLPLSQAAENAHQDRINHEGSTQSLINNMTCQLCGSKNLKLISWTDKKTGKPVKKWRCQDPNCEAWQKDK